ncbi:hypothetical protein [Paenibacillus illinoisensis]|uniref:hypothetical protein n=1 Tax=Paenibacillus illinoisensis TaxID=59845 RepID=UPI00301C264A
MWKKAKLFLSYIMISISGLVAVKYGLALFPALFFMPLFAAAMSTDSGQDNTVVWTILLGGYGCILAWIVLLVLSIITVVRYHNSKHKVIEEIDWSKVPKDGRIKS